MKLEDLKKPLPKIHWRAQSMNKEGTSAMALAYMDARDVMDRLDAVCEPHMWQDSYVESAKGRVICTISILIGDQWVSKSDGAGDTAVEGEKGGISDAFKRAAVKWGIGRYLYDMGAPWADCESYTNKQGKLVFKKWTPTGLKKLAKIHPAAPQENVPEQEEEPKPKHDPVPTITDEQRGDLVALFESLGVNVLDFNQRVGIKDLRVLSAARYDDAVNLIQQMAEEKV